MYNDTDGTKEKREHTQFNWNVENGKNNTNKKKKSKNETCKKFMQKKRWTNHDSK